jgi:hypothetical protein
MRSTAILLLAVALAACSKAPTVIDGSSPEAFNRTTEKARRDLPIKDRLTFDAALHSPGGLRFGNKDPEAMAREAYHGMRAADVVADARARGIE